MKNKTIINPLSSITGIVTRFSLVLFVIIITSGLIFSVLVLKDILDQPYNDDTQAINSESITIDQTTIDTLNNTKAVNDNLDVKTLPSGRINPFSE